MSKPVKMRTIWLILVTLMMLTACGQKRALYLPSEPQSNTQTTPSAPASKAVSQEKE